MHLLVAGAGWMRCGFGLAANEQSAWLSSMLAATLSCWIFQPMRHSSSAPFSPSAILVLFPSAVAKPATQLHRRDSRHNDIVTRQYSADHPNPVSRLCTTRRISSHRYYWHLDTAGEERVRIGKGPRKIIGKKSDINGARVQWLVFHSQKILKMSVKV